MKDESHSNVLREMTRRYFFQSAGLSIGSVMASFLTNSLLC